MMHKDPTLSTLKALFAKSGNQCAFPDCNHAFAAEKSQVVIAHICHIEARAPNGPRHNSSQSDDARRSYDNLILLCPTHHAVIDSDAQFFTVEKLKEMRQNHEDAQTHTYHISQATLSKFASETAEYWQEVELLNTVKHIDSEMALPINTRNTFSDSVKDALLLITKIEEFSEHFSRSDDLLMKDLLQLLEDLGLDTEKVKEVKYYENPFIHRNWEIHAIGFGNVLAKLRVLMQQLEIKYLEEYLKTNAHDRVARDRFDTLKNELRSIARHVSLFD